MRRRSAEPKLLASAAAAVAVAGAAGAAATGLIAGPQGDGTAITPVGYRVTPAGRQTTLGDLPLAMRLSPDGKTLLVSNDGQGDQSLQVVDPQTSKVVQTISYPAPKSVFAGLAFSPDGSTAYASGGGDEQVHVYRVAGGRLTEGNPITLPATDAAGAKVNMFLAGLQVTPNGKRLVVADHLADAVSVVDLATGEARSTAVGHAPFGVAVSPDGTTAYVTDQGAGTVSVVDLTKPAPAVRATVMVGTHPNAEVLDPRSHRLYVADGDSDQVSVVDTGTNTVTSTVDLAPYAHARVGTTPTGVALSPDKRTLYVSDAGNDDVDVVDLAKGRVAGSIPTGWYPSAVVDTASKLFVANAKGLGAGPNDGPGYPDPATGGAGGQNPAEYSGSMIVGTLSTVAVPLSEPTLAHDTALVAADDGFHHPGANRAVTEPIKHVIYVVRENRTYDQEFGSLGKGNGDPQLDLFGRGSAPNSRALERRFVTLDNFYADAEVSAQGWNWDVAAGSGPYTEGLWPADYSGRNAPYPSESGNPAIAPNKTPADAYIWDHLADASVSFRNYGFYVSPNANNREVAADPVLNAGTDHAYRGFDLNCPDSPGTFKPLSANCGPPRISEWLREFHHYVSDRNLPTVELVRLPNDHTSGTKPGTPTAKEYVADNDLALGKLVGAVSHSPYWKTTAIFVTEDDAQNGPDHVDAHRTTSELISPYTQTGKVDWSFYSTVSMLRTIEDIVGIRPLTQFDTYATPMTASFTDKPDDTPYDAVRPADAGNTLQTSSAPMAAASAAQSPVVADQLDSRLLNEAIWKSIKGARSPMPAPQHNLLRDEAIPG